MPEEDAQLDPLRGYELCLLRCSLPSPSPSDHQNHSTSLLSKPSDYKSSTRLHTLIKELIYLIESGEYVRALSSDSARTVFKFAHSDSHLLDDAERFYSDLVLKCVNSFVIDDSEDEFDRCYRTFLVMGIAVAAFLAFAQCNMTGPFQRLPLLPLTAFALKEEELGGGGGVEWEGWARNQLMSAGSDLLGKFSNLQHIVFAKLLLTRITDLLSEGTISSMDGLGSISWWLARLLLLQQRMLDERSSSLFDLLQVYMCETSHRFGTSEKVKSYWGAKLEEEEASTIVSMFHLEAGIMEYTYGRVDPSRLHFESAEVASGLQLSVTGALGFRTVHQVEPKAQLVLVANTSASNYGATCSSVIPEVQGNASSIDGDSLIQHRHQTCESSDVLMSPRFVEDSRISDNSAEVDTQNGGISGAPLNAIQQAVILAHCLSIEKTTRHDEMQRWEMAPYIEAIDSQQSSYFTIQRFCDILRIRWESTRSRTKERALLMMDKLVQGVYELSPGVAQRIYCCFGAYIPTIPALRKEYGEILVSCGLIGEAVKVFEDLELWDNLIYCYCLLEKKAAAVELIKARLSKMPTEPRLWCSLGDVTNNDSCYEKALEVSDNRSVRAKRSLARSAYNREDYETSKILWESAMASNSLYPDGWFALGSAALKARDVEKALDGFTRAVQLDPENGEAWNNIACLHMIKKKNKESFVAFKEALKFKRNSWQLWENFSHVSADISNFSQALEAIQMVLDMTNNKRIDTELLERIMLEIEGRALTRSHSYMSTDEHNDTNQIQLAETVVNCVDEPTDSEVGMAKTRETDHLVEVLGKILRQIVRSGGGADIWGLYARWHKLKGDLTMCSEALLKQVRSYQGSDLWKHRDRFLKFAHASLELCKVYVELSSCTGSHKELLAAEMHLKNIIKQAESFSDTEEFRDLQACLEEVQMKLQSNSVPAV
ncbi:uncharacterized protein LOC132282985 [Cornus florida]|uniref:uncharacterized protein LOC132282985 n=1 Tax=Cornus florida TaxID=4283 RepID=UPI00289E57FE|nr:uncharacterized protein LOC132282985 [Cornus florida]